MHELGLMERFADPALYGTLTQGEKVAGGLITTLMGIGTTFVILILLWGVIALTSKIIRNAEGKTVAKVATKVAEKAALTGNSAASTGVIPSAEGTVTMLQPAAVEGNELIAVLMAAIAASSGTEAMSNLKIRKIERISGYRPAWNSAGSADSIDSRKF